MGWLSNLGAGELTLISLVLLILVAAGRLSALGDALGRAVDRLRGR